MGFYIYDDDDNQPMNDENMPYIYDSKTEYNPPRPERDCPNCRFKMPDGSCTRWSCDFAPKQYVIEEVKEWLEKERTRRESQGK